ncbi:GntR family transcriptional regulator [Nonomuraea typhae]|uniref:GntR family transcriptional regulator n=1 Tax=Nonomuraea typhae TaxID=2603600 RepID=UPI0015E218DC|nr:GntR family transcriptional regulator [Nonomuraea typhae]
MSAPFRRIAAELRRQIADGTLAPGDLVPSESELVARFGTSRETVRKALNELKREGHIQSTQGARSRVRRQAPTLMQSTGAVWRLRREGGSPNFNAQMAASGQKAEQRLLFVEIVEAVPEIAERLQIPDGANVVMRRLLFFVDGEPVQRSDGYYPAAQFADTAIARNERIAGGALAYVEDVMGRRIARFIDRIAARLPRPDECVDLRIDPGVPVARTLRVALDESGTPVEVLDTVAIGERHLYEYEIDVPPATA